MRNITILSLSFASDLGASNLDAPAILALLDAHMTGADDIVILPETCLGNVISEPGDPFLSGIAERAARHHTYILAAVYLKRTDDTQTNSALLFDRDGHIAMQYDKVYPYWNEFDIPGMNVIPGDGALCVDTDFGRVSAAICFDANFSELWRDIADLDADLVLFSSAYSAGRQLCAHAINHHYAIATATQKPDFALYDIDGREITYNRRNHDQVLVSRARIDMDRVICHHNFNREKIERMLSEHPHEMELQHDYEREEWCVLRSTTPDVSAKALCRAYGIESLRDYHRRSRKHMEVVRGKPVKRPGNGV